MQHLLLKPVAWSVVKSAKEPSKASIQLFAYDEKLNSVYLNIVTENSLVINYDDEIEEKSLVDIKNSFNASEIKRGLVNSNILILYGVDIDEVAKLGDANYYLDRQGVLASFFEHRGLSPYGWISVNNYEDYPVISTQHHHYKTFLKYIDPVNEPKENFNPARLMFWDIETYTDSGEFTNPENDPVTLISIVFHDGKDMEIFILSRIKSNPITKPGIKLNMIFYKSEKDLLSGFFNLWRKLQPDRVISYNGYTYDMPYIIKRSKILDVSFGPLGKIKKLDSRSKSDYLPTSFLPQNTLRIITPGVEHIDLLIFFRLFYPWLPNHKLNTVSEYFLHESKTDLEIEEMFNIFKSEDPERMKDAIEYSIQDSVLLYNLYVQFVEIHLEKISNGTTVTTEELLTFDSRDVIDRMLYHIDPSTCFPRLNNQKEIKDITIRPESRVYINVHIYDYSNLLYGFMIDSEDILTSKAAHRLERAGMRLIRTLWDSYATSVDPEKLESFFNFIVDNGCLVELSNNVLVTTAQIDDTFLNHIDHYLMYAIITNTSRYVIIDDRQRYYCFGRGGICQPDNEFAKELISNWVNAILDRNEGIELPQLDSQVIKYVRKIKIDSQHEYSNDVIKSSLFQQVKPITTFKYVKYLMTVRGPEVFKNQRYQDLALDYYSKEIERLYQKLITISGKRLEKVYYNGY